MDIKIKRDEQGKTVVQRGATHLCFSRERPHFDTNTLMVRKHRKPVIEDGKQKVDKRGHPVFEQEEWKFEKVKRFGGA